MTEQGAAGTEKQGFDLEAHMKRFQGEPTPPRAGDATFAPGADAAHRYAVRYQGEFETPWDGTAVAVRAHARALHDAGIPVSLTSFSHVIVNQDGGVDPIYEVGLPSEVEHQVGELHRLTAAACVPVIRHAVLRSPDHAQQVLIPRGLVPAGCSPEEEVAARRLIGGATILYSVWERHRIDDAMVRELNRAGQLWVPCQQNARALIDSGVREHKVVVVPHPYDPNDDICKVARRPRHEHGWRLFYSIGRWEPRKGYEALIRAFFDTFSPRDKVKLTIKYTGGDWPGYPSPREAVEIALQFNRSKWNAEAAEQRLEFLSGRGPRTGIIELHYRNNIYVCSSHGEAWCLPAFEAKLAGNGLVYVPYGGVCDFASALDVAVPETQLGLVPESYKWPAGSTWAEYSEECLGTALRSAQVPRDFAPDPALSRFTSKTVGQQMRNRVLELTDIVSPEAAAYYRGLGK